MIPARGPQTSSNIDNCMMIPAGTHGDDGDDSANLAFHPSAGTRRYPQVPAGTHGDALYKLTAILAFHLSAGTRRYPERRGGDGTRSL